MNLWHNFVSNVIFGGDMNTRPLWFFMSLCGLIAFAMIPAFYTLNHPSRFAGFKLMAYTVTFPLFATMIFIIGTTDIVNKADRADWDKYQAALQHADEVYQQRDTDARIERQTTIDTLEAAYRQQHPETNKP